MERLCLNCEFWEGISRELPNTEGVCHRYPPTILQNEEHIHPVMDYLDWCGEFKEKEQEEE